MKKKKKKNIALRFLKLFLSKVNFFYLMFFTKQLPSRKKTDLELFEIAKDEGKLATAVRHLKQAIAESPNDLHLRLERGKFYRYAKFGHRETVQDLIDCTHSNAVRLNATRLLIDCVWEREGASPNYISYIDAILDDGTVAADDLIRYAAYFAALGMSQRAQTLVRDTLKKHPDAEKSIGYVNLILTLQNGGLELSTSMIASRCREYLTKSQGAFAARVAAVDRLILIGRELLPKEVDDLALGPNDLTINILSHSYDGLSLIFRPDMDSSDANALSIIEEARLNGSAIECVPDECFKGALARLGAIPSDFILAYLWIRLLLPPDRLPRLLTFPGTAEPALEALSRHDGHAERRLMESYLREIS